MEISITPEFYTTEQHYTGWYPAPGTRFVGNGIAVTDRAVTWQGEFGSSEGFPNGGEDLYNPRAVNEWEITKFSERAIPEDVQVDANLGM
jgi:hypothetical protein